MDWVWFSTVGPIFKNPKVTYGWTSHFLAHEGPSTRTKGFA